MHPFQGMPQSALTDSEMHVACSLRAVTIRSHCIVHKTIQNGVRWAETLIDVGSGSALTRIWCMEIIVSLMC